MKNNIEKLGIKLKQVEKGQSDSRCSEAHELSVCRQPVCHSHSKLSNEVEKSYLARISFQTIFVSACVPQKSYIQLQNNVLPKHVLQNATCINSVEDSMIA